jgi:hypothetical protein
VVGLPDSWLALGSGWDEERARSKTACVVPGNRSEERRETAGVLRRLTSRRKATRIQRTKDRRLCTAAARRHLVAPTGRRVRFRRRLGSVSGETASVRAWDRSGWKSGQGPCAGTLSAQLKGALAGNRQSGLEDVRWGTWTATTGPMKAGAIAQPHRSWVACEVHSSSGGSLLISWEQWDEGPSRGSWPTPRRWWWSEPEVGAAWVAQLLVLWGGGGAFETLDWFLLGGGGL